MKAFSNRVDRQFKELTCLDRSETGDIAVLGELADDAGLIERAARKLVG